MDEETKQEAKMETDKGNAKKDNSTNYLTKNGNINFVFANIQGLITEKNNCKIKYLETLLNEEKFDFAIITESHLHKCKDGCERSIEDSEVKITNYNIFRTDRTERTKGGCCIFLKENLKKEILISKSNDCVELLGIKMEKLNLYIFVIYRPPNSEKDKFEEMIKEIRNTLKDIAKPMPNILICGDFNFPFLEWKNINGNIIGEKTKGCTQSDREQLDLLIRLNNDFQLTQEISENTRKENCLDLLFTNNSDLIQNIKIYDTIHSDHKMIEVFTRLSSKPNEANRNFQNLSKTNMANLNYHDEKIDWEKIKQMLRQVKWHEEMQNKTTEECYFRLEKIVGDIIQDKIPPKKEKVRKLQICREKRTLFRKKRKLINTLQKCTTQNRIQAIEKEIQNYEAQIKRLLMSKMQREEDKAVDNIKKNPRYFYSFAKRKTNMREEVGPLKMSQGSGLTSKPQQIADILKEQYESAFSKPKADKRVTNPSLFFGSTENEREKISDIEFDEADIVKAINNVKTFSAAGPDAWNAKLIKNCKLELAQPLYIMWRKSLDTGTIPNVFKTANIAPIYKGGDRTEAKNYRPVALTSHLIKIFERIIREKITMFLENTNKLNKNQHGFRAGRSCLSQLIEHYDNIIAALERKHNFDVIYTDFAKAFDKCDHGIIAHKIREAGIVGKLGLWLYNFLDGRKQKVVVQGTSSQESEVLSSVPQGTVLAPILFLILLSDIDKDIIEAFVKSFADDTKIGKEIEEQNHITMLQNYIIKIFEWAEENNMQFNPEKFQLLRYGKNENLKLETYHTKEGTIIQRKNMAKDLGIIMQDDANFNLHYEVTNNKARKIMGQIMRSFKSRDPKTMLTLWKALIVPITDYCSVLTSPYKQKDIEKLESLQRAFTNKIELGNHMNYWKRLEYLKLYSLERRRERYTIIYTWKILENKVINLENQPIMPKTNGEARNGRTCKIPQIRSHQGIALSLQENTFKIRGPKLFNAMPKEIRNITGVNTDTFKKQLDKWLRKVPDEPGFPGYTSQRRANSNSILDQRHYMKNTGGDPVSTREEE